MHSSIVLKCGSFTGSLSALRAHSHSGITTQVLHMEAILQLFGLVLAYLVTNIMLWYFREVTLCLTTIAKLHSYCVDSSP